MAGSAYALSLFYAIGTCGAQMDCRNGSAWLYAPLIGPFMTAGQAPTSGGRALAIFDGALQTVGVALFVAGFLAPKKVVVMYRDASWRVEPVQMGSGMGLGLTVKNL
jgi:NADH:ubiquinone oxidoreductase subunit F (NADH-binding)